ncbi:MAG: prolipoprotein diacylglyceryl transferase [Candidatus Melainabacteria bacterium RIFCSPHIGHO2_02_FULL_34_12]|nr:MAG: prolipoprotein diacylglyceryl transferase [Candidatus Melainabacteria bacterium RIFCSPHIGHO2_02_FULL_34_12]
MLNNIPFVTLVSPGSVAFQIGTWPVRWYGIFVAFGFLVAYFLAERLIQKNNLSVLHFADLIFWILISSVAFARLYFVFLSWDYFKEHLNEIPKIWYGGQSIHGGIFGTILATLVYCRIKKISFYKYIDVIALVAPLGQSIGRWGNFFNNEAFGLPVKNSFIRLYIPQEFRPDRFIVSEYFHPVFLYESLINLAIFIFLFKKYSEWKKNSGKVFWFYLLSYSVIRFFLEFIRTDSLYVFGHFAGAQVISVIIFIVSVFFLMKR